MAHKQNYVDKMEQTKQRRIASGLVSERFPEVSDIVINMTYYQKGLNPVMMVRIVNFLPSRHAYFHMDCMIKGCADGGFDLTSVITKMIKGHKKTEKGKLVCKGKSEGLASDHASIDYEVIIKYNKK